MNKLWDIYAKFFGIVELEGMEDRIDLKGVKRVVMLGFIIGFIAINLLTYLSWGRATNFLIPSGLTVNRLVFITFLLQFLYHQVGSDNIDKIAELDEKYSFGLVYDEEKHGEYVVKKHGV